MSDSAVSFFAKHEFLIRRLHSLTGLVPVGAYMTVHLVVNASLLNGASTFQKNVNQIHALGKLLPLVEWTFIFLPIIFHALIGIWIIRTGKSNVDHYPYQANWRYSAQRWTGMIAVVFIFTHVFHLHGWFHGDWWLERVAEPLGMAQFRPYNAASTLAVALGGYLWPVFYLIGIAASVFHFANGLWTMGITWGIWISPSAQRRASAICAVIGGLLMLVGISALVGALQVDVEEAKRIEDEMYEAKVASHEITPDPHKRSGGHDVTGAAGGDTQPDTEVDEVSGGEAVEEPASGDDSESAAHAPTEAAKTAEVEPPADA